MKMAAHELLETSEALRTKAAEIEQLGFFANQCQDPNLKGLLVRQQQLMVNAYQQGVNILQGKGGQVNNLNPTFNGHNIQVGLHNQVGVTANPNSNKLTDITISTLTLNNHKSGAVNSMIWANECVDPQIRSYHVQGAVMCQEMAYETWQWMNAVGFYNAPDFQQNQINQMTGTFQPIDNMNNFSNNPGMYS